MFQILPIFIGGSMLEYERFEAVVLHHDVKSGTVLFEVSDCPFLESATLHVSAFIGGPMRLPCEGDKLIVSFQGGRAVSARIMRQALYS